MLAPKGDVSERVIRREERWKFDVLKVFNRENAEDASYVSCIVKVGNDLQRQPGQDTL